MAVDILKKVLKAIMMVVMSILIAITTAGFSLIAKTPMEQIIRCLGVALFFGFLFRAFGGFFRNWRIPTVVSIIVIIWLFSWSYTNHELDVSLVISGILSIAIGNIRKGKGGSM